MSILTQIRPRNHQFGECWSATGRIWGMGALVKPGGAPPAAFPRRFTSDRPCSRGTERQIPRQIGRLGTSAMARDLQTATRAMLLLGSTMLSRCKCIRYSPGERCSSGGDGEPRVASETKQNKTKLPNLASLLFEGGGVQAGSL